MLNVVCTLVLLTSNGRMRQVVQAYGKIVKDDNDDKWLVDFTEEINNRKLDPQWNNYVQTVNGNSCLFTK